MNAIKVRKFLQAGYDCILSERVCSQEEAEQLKEEFNEALEEIQEFEDWAEALIRDQR